MSKNTKPKRKNDTCPECGYGVLHASPVMRSDGNGGIYPDMDTQTECTVCGLFFDENLTPISRLTTVGAVNVLRHSVQELKNGFAHLKPIIYINNRLADFLEWLTDKVEQSK